MVKLREAFSHKIHLHIRQGMLQRLWDKYVPAGAPEYEQIQLIYLGEQAHGEQAQYGRTNLLINLVLKNRIMQMGLAQCPVKTAFVRKQMENSLQRMGRFYLTQLKCCDFVMYRKAEQFVSVLEQAQAGRIRYRKWQKESQSVEKQREYYHMISKFAINIRGFLAEHSQQTMRVQEKELLHLLSKEEYREFCQLCRLQKEMEYVNGQTVKWKKNKDKMLYSIDRLEATKIRGLWAQMEHLAAQGAQQREEKLPEWGKEEFTGNRDTVLMYKLMQIRQQYRREVVRGFWQHVLSVVENEQFKVAAGMTEISWKGLKRQLFEEERVYQSEEERYMQFSGEERVYQKEEERYMQFSGEERHMHLLEEERVYLSGESVREFLERIEEILEQQKRRIERQEAQIITSYQEIYRQASVSYRRENRMEEETARKLLVQINQLQAEKKEEFVEKLAESILLRQQAHITAVGNARGTDHVNEELSFVLANTETEQVRRSFGYTKEEINALISYIAYVIEKKDKREAVVTEKKTEEIGTNTTEFTEKQAQELFWQILSVMEKKTALNTEEYAKREIEEILSYIVDKSVQDKVSESVETAFKTTEGMLHSVDGQREQRMLLYIHNLPEESRREFIEKLAERILVRQQMYVTEEQMEGLLSYISYVIENKKKAGEIISQTSHLEERNTEEVYVAERIERNTEEIHAAERIERNTEELHVAERVERNTEEVYAAERVERNAEEVYAAERIERNTEEIHVTELVEREAVELYLQLTAIIEKKQEMRLQRTFAGRQDFLESSLVPYEKLWEWGKALLLHPEQGEAAAEADFLPTWKEGNTSGADFLPTWKEGNEPGVEMSVQDLSSFYDSRSKEEIQTEIIRRQIEAAKERNALSQLIYQINYRISSAQEEKEEGREPGEKLVYADGQLNLPEVKSLLSFVGELDERQYGRLVEELAEITKLQWELQFGQSSEETEIAQMEDRIEEREEAARDLSESVWVAGSQEKQYLAIAYPALVYRIEEFEKYRQREVRGEIQTLGRMYLQQEGNLPGKAEVVENALRYNREIENIWVKEGQMLDLQHSVQESTVSGEEQQMEQTRMREENAQLKLAQEQIGRKLKEVEVQLQKVETTARAREDVRAFAEQVKSQLYEELHVEKLRRGLI